MTATEAPARQRFPHLLALGVLLALLVLAVAALRSYRDLAAQRAEETRLQERIRATQQRVDALEGRIRRLKKDPAALEAVAREELGLVRPDDVVVVFPQEPATARRGPATPSAAPKPAPPPPRPPQR